MQRADGERGEEDERQAAEAQGREPASGPRDADGVRRVGPGRAQASARLTREPGTMSSAPFGQRTHAL